MHEPFRIPQGWTGQERRLVAQMEEVFDDLYRRFGRLRIEDMGKDFQLTWFDMGDNIAIFNGELYGDEETGKIGLTSRMEDAEGNVTSLWTNARGLATEISNSQGDINRLQITAQGMATEISDAKGNINRLFVTAEGYAARLENDEKDINELLITAEGYGVRLKSAEGNIAELTLTADGLTRRFEDTDRNVNTLIETAKVVERRLSDAEGNVSTLTMTAQGLDSRVTSAERNVSTISQRADTIEAAVFDANGDFSGVNITSTGLTLAATKKISIVGGSIEISNTQNSQGSIEIKSGSKLKLESGGTLDITSTNFSVNGTTGAVTVTGILTANAGSSIGGWHIGSNYIGNDDALSDSTIGLYSGGSGTDVVIWSGGSRTGTAKFKVDANGKLTASDVYITGGELEIGSNFSVDTDGYMVAKWGKIAGWNFLSNRFYRGSGGSYLAMGYYQPNPNIDTNYYTGFWVGTSDGPQYAPVSMYIHYDGTTNHVYFQTTRLVWAYYENNTFKKKEINLAALANDYPMTTSS